MHRFEGLGPGVLEFDPRLPASGLPDGEDVAALTGLLLSPHPRRLAEEGQEGLPAAETLESVRALTGADGESAHRPAGHVHADELHLERRLGAGVNAGEATGAVEDGRPHVVAAGPGEELSTTGK